MMSKQKKVVILRVNTTTTTITLKQIESSTSSWNRLTVMVRSAAEEASVSCQTAGKKSWSRSPSLLPPRWTSLSMSRCAYRPFLIMKYSRGSFDILTFTLFQMHSRRQAEANSRFSVAEITGTPSCPFEYRPEFRPLCHHPAMGGLEAFGRPHADCLQIL